MNIFTKIKVTSAKACESKETLIKECSCAGALNVIVFPTAPCRRAGRFLGVKPHPHTPGFL